MDRKYIVSCKNCLSKRRSCIQEDTLCSKCQKLYVKNLSEKKCPTCKKTFEYKMISEKRRKFCSTDCKNKSQITRFEIPCVNCKKKTFNQKFCSNICKHAYLQKISHADRFKPTDSLKITIFKKYNFTCAYCKTIKHEKMVPLQIHHIDWNPRHTVEDNLAPLCISCHRRMQKRFPMAKNRITDEMLFSQLTL